MTPRDSRLSFVELPQYWKKSVQSRTEITSTGTFRASAILATDPSCCFNFALVEFQGEMTRALASHSRWFWQTNLSRNNDGPAVLDGDDETNGMCPIIGSGRNVHIVGLSTPNTLKHPTMFDPSSSPFTLSVGSWISVCLFIRLCVSVYSSAYLICRLPVRVFMNLCLIARQRGLAGIKSSFNLGNRTGYFALIMHNARVHSIALMRFVIMFSHLRKLHQVQIPTVVN